MSIFSKGWDWLEENVFEPIGDAAEAVWDGVETGVATVIDTAAVWLPGAGSLLDDPIQGWVDEHSAVADVEWIQWVDNTTDTYMHQLGASTLLGADVDLSDGLSFDEALDVAAGGASVGEYDGMGADMLQDMAAANDTTPTTTSPTADSAPAVSDATLDSWLSADVADLDLTVTPMTTEATGLWTDAEVVEMMEAAFYAGVELYA